MMNLTSLTAISPIDGRYRSKVEELAPYFSEYGLIQYRARVEIEYLISLGNMSHSKFPTFSAQDLAYLRKLYTEFDETDAMRVKDIEKTTNHDVKAVEYFIKEKIAGTSIETWKEYVHFGLTSQDVNNTAIPLLLKEAHDNILLPVTIDLIQKLTILSKKWADIPMLARTHGQPASPTKVGKEIAVFIERLEKQLTLLKTIPFSAKFGGATGNFNAHFVAFPDIDWIKFANTFVEQLLGLTRSQYTTQIEHYDHLAAYFDNWKRISTILIDLCRDVWTYISFDYFKQKIKEHEVGSSAMPHKVNPIDFENAEGNLGIAIALFEHFSKKLPISRLQRDLTDSTVLRNIGSPFSHICISIKSIEKGLDKLLINNNLIEKDLEKNWMVVAEAIQTILRREKVPNAYEKLKELTRTNQQIDEQCIHRFIDGLDIDHSIKKELKNITPYNYTGIY